MLNSQFWHACDLKHKSEKIVQKKIDDLGIEFFLPFAKYLKIYKTSKRNNVLLPQNALMELEHNDSMAYYQKLIPALMEHDFLFKDKSGIYKN